MIELIDAAFNIVTNTLIPLAFALGLFYFFWGVAKYIREEGQGKSEGRSIMIWGVVGIFVAFSIWGIVSFIRTELELPDIQKVNKSTVEDVSSQITFPK